MGTQTICTGVPQGLILETVLFILYTNDLPNYSKELIYADDSVLLLGIKSPDDHYVETYSPI